jgi:glycosyltransferase involved in cell wall biosynthesis
MAISISVVIPAKNRASTLVKCLESVLSQTYPASEIIIVDDHSNDGTNDLLDQYKHLGVKCLSLPDGLNGAQAARSYGVMHAKSDWIAFHDSDDIWVKDKLLLQYKALEGVGFNEFYVVHGNCIRRDISSNTEEKLIPPTTRGNCFASLLLRPGPYFPALLASKRALSISGLDIKCPSYQEWDTSIRLSKQCQFVHLIDALFIWQISDSGAISRDAKRDVLGYDYVVEAHKAEILSIHGAGVYKNLKLVNTLRACKFKLWNEAKKLLPTEYSSPIISMIKLCIMFRLYPKGLTRLVPQYWEIQS